MSLNVAVKQDQFLLTLTDTIMSTDRPAFHDAPSLSKAAAELGQRALQRGLIHSFVVRHFADSSQFYIPDEQRSPLTPEQAYMQFKSLLEQAT